MNDLITAVLLSFGAPLVLLLVEAFLPFPELVEELVKLFLVLIAIRAHSSVAITSRTVALMGLLFGLTETVFYMVNYLAIGDAKLILWRFLLTGMMHVATFLILYLFARRGKVWMIFGLFCAIAIHVCFNALVAI